MVYKRSILTGGSILLIVILISALTFYFSLGPCPQGTFACDNGTLCLPQRKICDERNDCTDGSDEHTVECGMLYGSKELMAKLVVTAIARKRDEDNSSATAVGATSTVTPAAADCEIKTYPKRCTCKKKTYLLCGRNAMLTEIPKISAEVTHILVIGSNITLKRHSFQGLNLTLLTLTRDNISTIPLDAFAGQTSLDRLKLSFNKIESLPLGLFRGLSSLEWLFLNSNRLKHFPLANLKDLPKLEWLNLTENLLTLENDSFPRLENIYEICVDHNVITTIDDEVFKQLDMLHLLSLNFNRITHVHARAFWGLKSIREIRLLGNPLKFLSSETFARNMLLDVLYLGETGLSITVDLLQTVNVSYLNLDGITFENIEFKAIAAMSNLKYVVFEKFYFCSMTPQVRMCKPNSDGVSSFEDLLTKPVLRYSTWVMGFIIFIGNLMVLWGRFIYRDENRGVTMVIRNLALSDILMGFYLFTIGIQDYRYRNRYHKVAQDWISSWNCAAVGVLAVTSSEVSMLILAFMSLERFLLIADPFRGHHRLNPRNVFVSMLFIWLMGGGVAIVPVVLWRSSTMFYGTYSGTCFPLHIQEPYPLGWQYSAFMFIGLNLFLLLGMILLYTALMVSIWQTRKATPLSLLDCEFAVRFFFIVLTDVMCWAPIIAIKIWAFFRYNISDDTYAWLVIFVLPLNSAVNPLLYTFTTPKYRKQILLRGWQKFTSRKKMEASATGTASNPDESQSKGIPLLYNNTRTQST